MDLIAPILDMDFLERNEYILIHCIKKLYNTAHINQDFGNFCYLEVPELIYDTIDQDNLSQFCVKW